MKYGISTLVVEPIICTCLFNIQHLFGIKGCASFCGEAQRIQHLAEIQENREKKSELDKLEFDPHSTIS